MEQSSLFSQNSAYLLVTLHRIYSHRCIRTIYASNWILYCMLGWASALISWCLPHCLLQVGLRAQCFLAFFIQTGFSSSCKKSVRSSIFVKERLVFMGQSISLRAWSTTCSVFFLVNIFSLLFLTQFSFLNFNTRVSYYRIGNGDFFALVEW
jgi:hypothetical protein